MDVHECAVEEAENAVADRRSNDVNVWEKRIATYLVVICVGIIANGIMTFREDFTEFKTEVSGSFKNLSVIVNRHEKLLDRVDTRLDQGDRRASENSERIVKLETRARVWDAKTGG